MSDQRWARVPIELTELVDGNSIAVYVVLCKYAHRTTGRLWPSNPELVNATRLSLATVKRCLTQLEACGAIERKGRQSRKMHVVPIERLRLTGEPKSRRSKAHPRAVNGSPVSHGTRATEPDSTTPLRVAVRDDESEQQMTASDDDSLFEIDVPEREVSVVAACMRAFFDAYGTQTISRPMIGRIGKRFKELSTTYSRDELIAAASELGEQRIANPNAIEPFVLRARNPQQQSQARRSQWSALAADTMQQIANPFDQQYNV